MRLEPEAGFQPLGTLPLRMVCGLTGSGKSTTLAALQQSGRWQYRDDLPSRRDLADLVIIPAAQVHSGQAIQPVRDRAGRFRWTHYFAQQNLQRRLDSGLQLAALPTRRSEPAAQRRAARRARD